MLLLLATTAHAYLVPGDSHDLNPYEPRPGYGNDYGDRYGERLRRVIVRCESQNRRATACYAGEGIRDVRIVRQLSNSACVMGSTVRVDRSNIIVLDGCRADFEVLVSDRDGGYQPPRPPHRPPVRTEIVRCDSDFNLFNSCNVSGQIIDAQLVDQRSNSPCQLGRSWGYDGNRVWVDRGCRASFRVTLR